MQKYCIIMRFVNIETFVWAKSRQSIRIHWAICNFASCGRKFLFTSFTGCSIYRWYSISVRNFASGNKMQCAEVQLQTNIGLVLSLFEITQSIDITQKKVYYFYLLTSGESLNCIGTSFSSSIPILSMVFAFL